jgi:hypothetical protein
MKFLEGFPSKYSHLSFEIHSFPCVFSLKFKKVLKDMLPNKKELALLKICVP